ncbi:MAG TPA: NAD(P)H-dependent glycerol-3-phosphate dehydrogenase [Terriglobales bacterium]|nr:NAD(P)H-dependent glycerol-3-phosphate dehydrogenase [Terriglobales bacterium]
MTPLAIVGGGSWGTALAVVLGQGGRPVRLWVREEEIRAALLERRENPVFLPGLRLPPGVEPTGSLEWALRGAQAVIMATPSPYFRAVLGNLASSLAAETPLISAAKGLEEVSLMRMSEVAAEVLRPQFGGRAIPFAVLSGPTFAREVARGDPTAVVIASADDALARRLQREFSGPSLRLYRSDDVVGVELAAAIKNVIAIAAGICVGLGLGSNSLAALIARGLAEISRLVRACGGKAETVAGLAGLGDLVLTCNGQLSRNRSVGVELGKGRKLKEILAEMTMVAEGVYTTTAACRLAERHGIEMPITEQMRRVLFEDLPPREAVRALMERSLKPE